MKRMRYSEPTRGVSQTTCIRRLSTRARSRPESVTPRRRRCRVSASKTWSKRRPI
jgi:hypothetical protein